MKRRGVDYIWVILRLSMGWVFLWPFFDKLFGLGFATAIDKAWLLGNSPTTGFLSFATKGPFAVIFKSLAGSFFIDWLFMAGLLFIGLALIFGVGIRIASYAGSLMLFLMWLAVLPPEHNPFLDDHLIYIFILIGISIVNPTRIFGLGGWWSKTKLVKKYGFLE